MAEILLANGRGVVLVDDANVVMLSDYRWHIVPMPRTAYASARGMNGSTLYMHRLIMDAPKGMQVDHINRDGLDNRRANLRLATKSQNQANEGPRGGSSRYRGVYRITRGNRTKPWRAQVKYLGHRKGLGDYATEEEAARAYDAFALAAWGEFASLNNPD